MLAPSAHTPNTLVDEVPIVGGRLLLALSEPGDRLVLLPSCADPSLVQLDAGSVDALILALGDVRGRMRPASLESASQAPG